MKGKPIEPGCFAMIVNARVTPENNGRMVRVIRRSDGYELPPEVRGSNLLIRFRRDGSGWWVVPTHGTLLYRLTTPGGLSRDFQVSERSYRERCLIRIDDGEDYSQETTSQNLNQPTGETV